MARGRFKKRGLHQRGYKQDWETLSLDMCPHCYSFGCDPMAMSLKFYTKIHERLRKGLCPCCGEPKNHCKCKSSERIVAGTHAIRTHNNKKRRKAMAAIQDKERAYFAWMRYEELFKAKLGEEVCAEISRALHWHKTPSLPWPNIVKALEGTNINAEQFAAGWK